MWKNKVKLESLKKNVLKMESCKKSKSKIFWNSGIAIFKAQLFFVNKISNVLK